MIKITNFLLLRSLAIACVVLGTSAALADITIKVGYRAGGGYDLNARLVARHLNRFLADKHSIHVENVPGAGSMRLARMLFTTEPKDGSVIAVIDSFAPLSTLVNQDFSDLDMTTLKWIGGVGTKEARLCAVRSETGVKDMATLHEAQLKFGATGVGSYNFSLTKAIKNLSGADFTIVPGFKGTSSLRAAILRGEIDGYCAMRYRDIGPVFEEGLMQPFIQANTHHDPSKGVPHIKEVLKDSPYQEALDALIASERFRFAFALPSGTPDQTVAELRDAFSRMVEDSDFLEEAASLKLIPAPEAGEVLQALVEKMHSTPQDTLQKIREMTR